MTYRDFLFLHTVCNDGWAWAVRGDCWAADENDGEYWL